MSRSVSAPSSVTNTSPCWNGLIVPGSTLMYGSNFCICTFRPRAFSRRPREAAVIPLPSEETTPPVTKTYLVTGCQVSGSSGRQVGGRLHEVVEPPQRAGADGAAAARRAGDERPVLGGRAQRQLDVELPGEQVPRPALERLDRAHEEQRLANGAAGEDVTHLQPHGPARV